MKEKHIRTKTEPATATGKRNFGSCLTDLTAATSCFHLLCLSFSGVCRLPRPSLQKLNKCRRRPCFTLYSPRSYRYGFQRRDWTKSSTTCLDTRIWPASPQSRTRCATFIPDPAMFVSSLTSVTRLTGPLCTPIRNRSEEHTSELQSHSDL